MPSEYEDYLYLTQEIKSDFITYVAQIGNARACLTHSISLNQWILDCSISDNHSGNNDFFSFITITSPLLIITLTNETQTIAKEVNSAHSLPFLPLTSVIYVLDSLFNIIYNSKLTHDLNCLVTFSNTTVNLQDWSTRRTIGIG